MKAPEINTVDYDKGATLSLSGEDLKSLIMKQAGPEDVLASKKASELEAFMNSEMTVIVHPSADENEENPIMVGNNGKIIAFFRGNPTTCARKFVDSLCVRKTTVTTPETKDYYGNKTFGIQVRSAMKYPFQVIEDKHDRGPEWLKRKLAGVL